MPLPRVDGNDDDDDDDVDIGQYNISESLLRGSVPSSSASFKSKSSRQFPPAPSQV